MSVFESYLKTISSPQRIELERTFGVVKQLVPEAEAVMSYGMPTFKYKSKVLLHIGAFKNHISLFPASDEMVAAIGEGLAKHRVSKGTLQFTPESPLTEPLLKQIITFRRQTIER